MTRRERMEARLERRQTWAQSRTKEAAQRFESARKIADGIPLGQPILVGHHSEKHARRDQSRIHGNMSKGCEAQTMAARHTSVAGSLSHALDTNIFSDDSDAVTALESRIAARDAERARMRTVNALFRKKDSAGLAKLGLDLVRLQSQVAKLESWQTPQPYAKYELSNLGGRIAADRKRLESVKIQQERAAAADASPNGVALEVGGDYCRVTFVEKPSSSVLDALRAASFHWGAGGWTGRTDALPQVVRDLVDQKEESCPCDSGHPEKCSDAGAEERETMHERAHAGVSEPDECDRGADCPAFERAS
jgi:hypothetical protein